MTKLTQPNPQQLLLLASGRRMVNTCMFLGIASVAFKIIGTPLVIPLYLGLTLAAVLGTLQLAKGLAYTGFKLAFLVIGSVIPLLGYLLMASLGIQASKLLKAAGYKVGLFQATNLTLQSSESLPASAGFKL